jgi:hypothetical protein
MTWSIRSRRAALVSGVLALCALPVAVSADAGLAPPRNLIVNGGAEDGEASAGGYDVVVAVPGWHRSGKFTVVAYGAPDFPDAADRAAIRGGARFFAGGPANAASRLTQVIDVAARTTLIETGSAKATLSGFLGGYATQDDSLVATATFLGQSGSKLGEIKIGPVTALTRKMQTVLVKETSAGAVPKGTRKVRVTLRAFRTSGAYNDGYADNLSLTIGG